VEHFGSGGLHPCSQAGCKNEYVKRVVGLAGLQKLTFLDSSGLHGLRRNSRS
jgi:hypothetical protein